MWSSLCMFIFFLLFNRILFEVILYEFKEQQQEEMAKKAQTVSTLFSINDDEDKVNKWLTDMVINGERIRIIDSSNMVHYEASSLYNTNVPDAVFKKDSSFRKIKTNDYVLYVYRTPITTNNFTGTIEVSWNMKVIMHDIIESMQRVLFWGGTAAAIVSGLVGFILSRQLLLPLREMVRTMNNILQKGLNERMPLYQTKDEIGHLTNMFNEMMDEVEDSFNQQKQFIEDASHELRTPVTILEGHFNLLNRWGKDNPEILEESLRTSMQEVKRMKQLVTSLLELTKTDVEEKTFPKEIINPYDRLKQLIEDFNPMYPNIAFFLHEDDKDVAILIDGQQFDQIFRILVDNALKYSKSEEIILNISKVNEHILLSVIDKGIGISPEHLQNLFNRFYRVDQSRSREEGGSGLGLSIARNLVKKYKGTIEIQSEVGEGTVVTISFPAVYIS
ncbi:hypothetical protein BFG57_08525 [Bacillus solimangrovi]|uniref:histidine kinase n=1 Tax=Bacillus solimangrovi TaxID=1305675 RepID=A0A1E5LJU6_9BACI|nr:hypothetical protein BFG57_08525 [Bacillus solimangrovi]